MVAMPFQWIQRHYIDGGVESCFHWSISFMVNEVCSQYCKGAILTSIHFHLLFLIILYNAFPWA